MSPQTNFDVIIAGAGSIGTPTALFLAQAGFKVLVLDSRPSTGQGSNKHAIGGIRATHSDPAKILLCSNAIEIFSNWQAEYGQDIEWKAGGYSFVAYDEDIEKTLKDLLDMQRSLGLNINWLDRQEFLELVPDINPKDLRGGTYSPEDGSASPLKASFAFYQEAVRRGAIFHFNENVVGIETAAGKVQSITTDKGHYSTNCIINAAGSWSAVIGRMVGLDLPVKPDAHEAGITEAVQPMFNPMIVDIRSRPGSSNFYFYQHPTGKIIFCVTPNPQIWGYLDKDTSAFLPLSSNRLIETMPKLANCRVRRTWRGTYPMTPDGNPILGKVEGIEGFLLATGACGQGFMLGPGVGLLLSHLIQDTLSEQERQCLYSLRLDREWTGMEKLK
jgi:sarcosine oxidase subunit beta